MTTKHSSSPHVAKTAMLFDAVCRPIPLGKELGRGGEGSVYEVANDPTLVAKVYHKTPLTMDQVQKLEAMTARWSEALEAISAWPRSMLFDPTQRKPCGILMTKMVGAHPLHELYGTTTRRRNFPEVGWHHLVLAARNAAAAFHTMHSAGIVVGDVNQGNLLVDKEMCVRLIDCDSFQITRDGKTFSCPVGTPHFTPPELQNQKLREVFRSVNHDRFGMAILIFHLLFVGRHPFAGRYRGAGDMSIEKAIAESRFAFSKHKAATMIDPPPASLLLEDLPTEIADLFESAFRGGTDGGTEETSRPAPQRWVERLEDLMKRRKVCSFDPAHVYFAGLEKCPWCRIEDAGGPSFFVTGGGTSIVSLNRLARYDEKIAALREVEFPGLAPAQIALPKLPVRKRPKELPKRTRLDAAAAALAVGLAACVAAVASLFTPWPQFAGWALAAGTVLAAGGAGFLLYSPDARARRKKVADLRDWLTKSTAGLAGRAQVIELQYRQRKQAFEDSLDDFRTEIQRYRAEGAQLKDVILQQGSDQRVDYLRGFLIRDDYRKIAGLTPSHVALLESFGVESANDVERLKLYGIPNVDNELMMELLQWRTQIERGFVFNPEHGVTVAELRVGGDAAVKKFKVSQARRILTGHERLETLARTRRSELMQLLNQFEDGTAHWLRVAKQLREFENERRPLERLVNDTWYTILAPAVGLPLVSWLLYALLA